MKILRDADYEAHTFREQGLQGISDQQVYDLCCAQKLCLITLDLDFANVIRFPPHVSSGIVVIRPPGRVSVAMLEKLIAGFLSALAETVLEGELWIVEPGRIRIHQREEEGHAESSDN